MENTSERNKAIYIARINGASVSVLSKEYALSEKRIRAICKRQEEKLANEEDLLYLAIRVLTSDICFAGKVYGTLKRNGIDTVEQVKDLTDEELKKMRCCGPKMIELLENFRAMAGNN